MFAFDPGSCSPGSVIVALLFFPVAVVLFVVRLVFAAAVPCP